MTRRRGSWQSIRLAVLVTGALGLVAVSGLECRASAPPAAGRAARGIIENRGQIDPAVRYYAVGDHGAVYFTRETTPISPTVGIWLNLTGRALYHCQVEQDGPRCRQVSKAQGTMTPRRILGSFVLNDPSGPPVDVLWVNDGADVFRCWSTMQQLQPQCQQARVQ